MYALHKIYVSPPKEMKKPARPPLTKYFNNLFSVAKRLKTEISTFEYFYGCATKSPNDREFLDFIDNLKNIYINKINK